MNSRQRWRVGNDIMASVADDALYGPTTCPKCKDEASVIFDYIQGFSVCEVCGVVIQDEPLVSQIYPEGSSVPAGRFVPANDSGLGAAAANLHGTSIGRSIQMSRPTELLQKLRQHLNNISNALSLSRVITEQADAFMEQLRPIMPGQWKREDLAAAAVYIAVRQNDLPLTLLDLATATQTDVYSLGKFYRHALATLGLPSRLIQPHSLIERSMNTVLMHGGSVNRGLAPDGTTNTRLVHQQQYTSAQSQMIKDANTLVSWIDHHIVIGSKHPLTTVGCAIYIALEMNSIKVGLDYIATALHVGYDALSSQLTKIREKMLLFSSILPYKEKITGRNIFSYARTIVRLTNVVAMRREDIREVDNDRDLGTQGGRHATVDLAARQQPLIEEERRFVTEITRERRKRSRVKKFDDVNGKGKKNRVRHKKASQLLKEQKRQEDQGSEENGDGDELLVSDASDSEIDAYIRSAAEVEAFQKAQEALVRSVELR